MWLGLILGNKIIAGILIALVTVPPVAYGGIKANEYRQVQNIVQESKQLTTSGQYQEAINKLSEADNKWATDGIKNEVENLGEENKALIQATKKYELGKELFDKSQYKDAINLLMQVSSGNINYPLAHSLIELAEKKLESPISEVAGVKIDTKVVKSISNPPPIIPTSTPLSTPVPNPTSTPKSPVDWNKVAELNNIMSDLKRLATENALAQASLEIQLGLQSRCERKFYADEAKTIPYSPADVETNYQNCLSIYQPIIDNARRILRDNEAKLSEYLQRARVIEAECPECDNYMQK